MNDELLVRAQRAIRVNQSMRAKAREKLRRAKFAGSRLRETLRWARSVGVKGHPQLGLEMADRIAAALENPRDNGFSVPSEKT